MSYQVEKPKITEIQVRMDCNGCVQKTRRALQTVQGIYQVHEDFQQQKIVVVGWADPEKLMRAIKRTGKIAKLCSHHTPEEENAETEERADAATADPSSSATTVTQDPVEQSNQTVTEENAPAAAAAEEPPPAAAEESAPADAAQSGDPPPQENSDPPPPQEATGAAASDPVETYYMNIDHNHARHGYLIRNGLDGYHVAQEYPRDADYTTTRYNNNTDYLDAQQRYQRYMADQYYYNTNNGSSSNNGNSRQMTAADSSRFATMFSDENPNACCIT